jgi:ABC-type uncharacterized transport system permease subunit
VSILLKKLPINLEPFRRYARFSQVTFCKSGKLLILKTGWKITNCTSIDAQFNADFRNVYDFEIKEDLKKLLTFFQLAEWTSHWKMKICDNFPKNHQILIFVTYLNSTSQDKTIDVWFVYFKVIFVCFTILTLFLWENRKFCHVFHPRYASSIFKKSMTPNFFDIFWKLRSWTL